jgi:predicted Zn finger-like uncharacterized protein
MDATIRIVCPECGKQIKAPDHVLGKKVRCKSCQATFVAKKEGSKGPPAKSSKHSSSKPANSKAGKTAKVKPANPIDDDDEDANPYGMIDMSFLPRCPECANEMEEGAIICLTCGYNTRTRERNKLRKVYDLSGGEHFIWLLPGIACALAVLIIIGFNIWYLLKIDDLIDEQASWYLYMWRSRGIMTWVVIMSLFSIWFAGKFAVKRLILHPKPPEVEKYK